MQSRGQFISCILMLGFLGAPPCLADFDHGSAALKAGDFHAAMKEWLPIANAGNAQAQFAVGSLYFDGHGVDRDPSQAATWIRTAAEQGFAEAQYKLGEMYFDGEGVIKDNAEGVAWVRKAAEQGHANGLFDLGLSYELGSGVPPNPVLAYTFYSLAVAKSGDEQSQKNRDRVAIQLSADQMQEGKSLAAGWIIGTLLPSHAGTWVPVVRTAENPPRLSKEEAIQRALAEFKPRCRLPGEPAPKVGARAVQSGCFYDVILDETPMCVGAGAVLTVDGNTGAVVKSFYGR